MRTQSVGESQPNTSRSNTFNWVTSNTPHRGGLPVVTAHQFVAARFRLERASETESARVTSLSPNRAFALRDRDVSHEERDAWVAFLDHKDARPTFETRSIPARRSPSGA